MTNDRPHDDGGTGLQRRDFVKLAGAGTVVTTLGAGALSGTAGAVTTSRIEPSDGFADVAPWLEDEDVDVYRIREATRAAVEEAFTASGARVVVFETSGTIDLGGDSIAITEDRCWVAGQTAPSPGITFVKGMIQVDANDCVVQHVRSRHGPGSDGNIQSNDSINTADDTANNVLDHVTASWGTDECLSVGYDTRDTTVTNCLVYEGLHDPYGDGSDHNYATLIGNGASNVTLAGNVWAKCRARLPRLKGGTSSVLANNLMYFFNESVNMDDDTESSIVGNVFVPQDVGDTPIEGGTAYLEDNITDPTSTPLTGEVSELGSRPLWPSALSAMDAGSVEEHNLANAGARPADRTENDARIVREIANREGDAYLDSPYDYWIPHPDAVGGYPELPENTRSLSVPDSGLRSWLGEWAAAVENGSGNVSTPEPTTPTDGGDDTPPSAPGSLSATGSTTTSVDLTWSAASDSGGSGIDHYAVSVGSQQTEVPAGTTSATVAGLEADADYEAAVVAVDGAGNESAAATTTVSTASEDADRTGGAGPITVRGGGADIWNDADEGHFYYGAASGDFDVAVRVDAVENTDEYAKAGLMVRESLDADAANVMIRRTPSATSVQWRAAAGGTSQSLTSDEGADESEVDGGTTQMAWQRLVRSGDTIRAYAADDGRNWTLLADLTVSLGDDVAVGLAVTSHSSGTLCTAEFDSWSGLALSDGTDLGSVDVSGSVSGDAGTPESGRPTVGDNENVPTDPDGDGLYEDVNGNGDGDLADAVDLYQNRESAAVQDNVDAFDFSGNEDIDLADVVQLYQENTS